MDTTLGSGYAEQQWEHLLFTLWKQFLTLIFQKGIYVSMSRGHTGFFMQNKVKIFLFLFKDLNEPWPEEGKKYQNNVFSLMTSLIFVLLGTQLSWKNQTVTSLTGVVQKPNYSLTKHLWIGFQTADGQEYNFIHDSKRFLNNVVKTSNQLYSM